MRFNKIMLILFTHVITDHLGRILAAMIGAREICYACMYVYYDNTRTCVRASPLYYYIHVT